MIRFFTLLIVAATALVAQPPSQEGLLKLLDQFEAAIRAGDWPSAAKLSRTLKDAVQDARNHSMAAGGKELAESILGWLPPDTETVLMAQQPFPIRLRDDSSVPTALEEAQRYTLLLLSPTEKEALLKKLAGRTLRLAALGARRFNEHPSGKQPESGKPLPLGMIPFQGCGVYAFAEPVPETILSRPPDESIMGHRVWTSQGSLNDEPDTYTFYISLPKPDLMLACNHRGFFEQVVSRMGLPARSRALPDNLPEWKYLDRSAPLWAITHYSANSIVAAGLYEGGQNFGATGLTLEFGLPSGRSKASMIATADPWAQLAGSPDFHGAAKSRQLAKGVWELLIEGKPEAANMAAFALMGMIGFIVLL